MSLYLGCDDCGENEATVFTPPDGYLCTPCYNRSLYPEYKHLKIN